MESSPLSIPKLIVYYPSAVSILFSSNFAFIALGPSPKFIPLILLLVTLKIYVGIIVHRQYAFVKLFAIWFFLTVSISASHLTSVLEASSSPGYALIGLISTIGLTSIFAAIPILVDIAYSRHVRNLWFQLSFFPAAWATTWWLVSYLSPIGRLTTWSPVQGLDVYDWIIPYFGPIGIDFLVGAWTVILSQIAGIWIVGTPPMSVQDDEGAHLISAPSLDENFVYDNRGNSSNQIHRSRQTFLFIAMTSVGLLALTSLQPVLPLPTNSFSTSMLSVACALPYKPNQNPTFDDYLAQTVQLVSTAKVILWPEGAVRFNSAKEKTEAVGKIQNIAQGSLIGVAFEEYAPSDTQSRTQLRRNGIMFIDQKHGVVNEYFKRNLVPCTYNDQSFEIVTITIIFSG